MEFSTLEANADDCLLLEYIRIIKKNRNVAYDPQNFQIAKGKEEIKKYFKDSFGEEGDIPEILSRVDDKMMRKILSQVSKNGEDAKAALYLCATGPGGGISKVYSKSRMFEF